MLKRLLMIKYVKGDIFKGGDDVIVHGCNCICNMGAGIALQVQKYYPEAFEADKATKYGDESKLGTYSSWTGPNKFFPEKDITIVNAYTQFSIFKRDFRNSRFSKDDLFEYDHFGKLVVDIRNDFEGKSIAFPKIGAGLAHGDWELIKSMINCAFDDIEVKVYIL
jgi:O-acetyl-ADP-ribose deacetylase (regulator of RNase III)